ncbi:UPF0149 family protein [Immundisolibacter sp.]|uniref:UPF0149 family protein n=1 Tax=Immundisolibacter sp. TaxID=1934948 RepID=UPI003565C9EE
MSEQSATELMSDVTDEDVLVLDWFLESTKLAGRAMNVSMLEGFLTAIVVGPRLVMPSEWLLWVWDKHDGEAVADFTSPEAANVVLQLVMRFYNTVIRKFMDDPAAFKPVCLMGEQWRAEDWCEGFLIGQRFDREAWALAMLGNSEWFAPFMRLGTTEGDEITARQGGREHWIQQIVPSLMNIHAFWLARRPTEPSGLEYENFDWAQRSRQPAVRGVPKVGRNDPCPCGSGRKFKKCCGGVAATLH